jgi:hypothetical protein
VRAFAITVLLASVIAAPATLACGYENPSDMALGLLNWVYPKALYVRTAVWKAEDAGILPSRSSNTAKDLFGGGFRRAAASMYGLGNRLSTSGPATGEEAGFTVVLIPAVMWTRFIPTAEDYSVKIHVNGPEKGDVVIVTDEKVVRALVNGSLDAGAAESHGLIRLYGPAQLQDTVRTTLGRDSVAQGTPRHPDNSAPTGDIELARCQPSVAICWGADYLDRMSSTVQQ